ncbi:hypothetical protein ACTL6P_07685 [Endozoicomonas acroporae]|uniref:hypothetical protein n=1 Tax=Endozoicomonas acroporae TaxID=1701104 RepID=UPI000C775D12|nr:hypothetical protein [Endozoicomonas acroporae]
MYPATTTGRNQYASTDHSASGSSALITFSVSQAFHKLVKTLESSDKVRCSETIQEMLWFINNEFPDVMLRFQEKSFSEREVTTLAENSSETRAVTISPMEKLIANHKSFDLITHLNSLVADFNIRLTVFTGHFHDSESCPSNREMNLNIFSSKLHDFGKDILKKTNRTCDIDTYHDSEACIELAEETKRKLEAWHNSVKVLSEGLVDPLLDKSEGLDHNSSEKENAISHLKEIQKLQHEDGKKDYHKIDILLRYSANSAALRETVRSRMSDCILKDFIGSDNLLVFLKTMQLLFDYYQFTPYNEPLGEIEKDLCDTIKKYAKMKKPVGYR